MSYTKFMDISNAVIREAVEVRNYNEHNMGSEKAKFKPVAFDYTSYADRSPESYIYPYTDMYNPFVMIEGSYESFTSFVYKLINPETFDTSMLLTPSVEPNEIKITNYKEMEKFLTLKPNEFQLTHLEGQEHFLSTHPAGASLSEMQYGIVIDKKG